MHKQLNPQQINNNNIPRLICCSVALRLSSHPRRYHAGHFPDILSRVRACGDLAQAGQRSGQSLRASSIMLAEGSNVKQSCHSFKWLKI